MILVGLCSFLTTCSKENDPPTGPEPQPGNIDLISVIPSSGPPGTALTIDGLQVDTADIASYSALLDGEAAPLRFDGDSSVQVAIPLFLDSALGWPSPPTDSVALEILIDGEVVARTAKVILIDSLPHASGTVAIIQGTIDTVLADFQLLFSALPVHHSWEQAYRDSLLAVVGSLISGPDTSLAAILDGSSSLLGGVPVDLELADALMASTGAAEYWREYLSAFSSAGGKLRQDIENKQTLGLLCPDLGPDMDLACSMQLYVLLHDWADEFLAETRTEWELYIGWVIDAIALVPGAQLSPPVVVGKLIGAILTISDVLVNNVVLSLLPSHISSFDMTLASETMDVDEFTSSQIFITAANSPESMTLNEMVDLVMAVVGFKATTAYPEFRMIVLNIVQFVIDKLRMVYSLLHSAAPDVFGDPNLVDRNWYTFPNITWGPVEVTSNDLVELFSFTPEILEPDSAVYEWWSVDCGEGRIQARTRAAGERSKVIRDWLFCVFCEYSGGAFGEDIAHTPTKSVTIGQQGGLEVDIAGLPEGEDADVLVIFPDGTTFRHLTATETLTDLESGEYEVQANEVTATDGTAYIGRPGSQTIAVMCDSTITADIEYVDKYGNILLTISGLPSGLAPDIVITGPDNYTETITAEGLIDSLLEGDYIITAVDVVEPTSGDTLTANPHSQTVSVTAGQTSLASVDYTGDLVVTIFYGPMQTLGWASAEYTDHNFNIVEQEVNYLYDGYDTSEFEVTNCVVTGYEDNGVSGAALSSTSVSSCSSSGSISATSTGFTLLASASASAALPSNDGLHSNEHASGNTNINFGGGSSITGFNRGVVVDIVNPSGDTVDIVVTWVNGATSSGSPPGFSHGAGSASIGASFPFDACELPNAGNDIILSGCSPQNAPWFQCSGSHTFTTTMTHSQAAFTASASAGVNIQQRAVEDRSGNVQTNVNLQVTVRKR